MNIRRSRVTESAGSLLTGDFSIILTQKSTHLQACVYLDFALQLKYPTNENHRSTIQFVGLVLSPVTESTSAASFGIEAVGAISFE